MTSETIIRALGAKHAQDVFIPECKDGPSSCIAHLRMDAWAMTKSWANACASGYEIKVSRSDFLGDKKWRMYLPLCNCFYFVAPQGIIDVKELPKEAGLLIASKNGSRLFTKKKAPQRDVKIPQSLYQYILMWRAKVVREHADNPVTVEQWKRWLAEKQEEREIGRHVSTTLAKTVAERIDRVNRENEKLTEQIKEFASVRLTLERLGIDDEYVRAYSVESKLQKVRQLVPGDLRWDIERSIGALTRLVEELKKLEPSAEALCA